jgi:hypothetical protein
MRLPRYLVAIASLGRLAYATGLLLAPELMASRRLAPEARGNSYARMTTRAFGAVHVNVAALTLEELLLNGDLRPALGLNIGCDVGDLIATLLEWRAGELSTGIAVGSAVVQSIGIATWSAGLRNRRTDCAA